MKSIHLSHAHSVTCEQQSAQMQLWTATTPAGSRSDGKRHCPVSQHGVNSLRQSTNAKCTSPSLRNVPLRHCEPKAWQSTNAKRGCSYTLYPTPYTLILAFLLTLAPLAHSAWNGGKSYYWYDLNPSSSSFTINSETQLAGLAQLVNDGNTFAGKTITLGADIELNRTSENGGWQNWETANELLRQWIPIGGNRPFSGTFDGAGHTISGLYISTESDYQGLFGNVSGAVIKNVKVIDGYVKGGSYVGFLAGANDGSTIRNSYATGNVSGTNRVGGLAGHNAGTIDRSYATGNVSGTDDVGGLAGNNSNGTISNSYAAGAVSGAGSVGGLAGNNSNGTISNSYAAGAVSGAGSVGGLAGNNSNGTISSSYYDSQTSGQSDVGKGIPKTTAQMKQKATFDGWNFFNIWVIQENVTYPYFSPIWSGGADISWYDSNKGSFIINTAEQLAGLMQLVNNNSNNSMRYKTITLGTDIELNDTTNWQNWNVDPGILRGWASIGNESMAFRGTFDGAGHTIRGLYSQPLFGYIGSEATIKNLGVIAGYVTGGYYTGFLADYNGGTIEYSYTTGAVAREGTCEVGGLVGRNGGTISNSYSTGTVTNTHDNKACDYGSLVGRNNGTIINSYAAGTVNVGSGALAGGGNGTITSSYAKSTSEIKQQATFSNWSFQNGFQDGIWFIDEGNDYPRLFWTTRDFENVTASTSNLIYTGDSIKPEISISGFTKDTHFKVYYFNNVNAGTARAIVWGINGTMGKKVIDFSIGKATLTVTADNKSMTYGNAVPALTITYSGFVNSETTAALSALPTVSTSASSTSDIGTYSIVPVGGAAANYNFNYKNGNLTITQRGLTVTGAVAQSKIFDGTTETAITGATLNGVVNGDAVTLANHTSGDFASPNAADGISVIAAMTLSGTKSSNYALTQPILSANIERKAVSIPVAVPSLAYTGSSQTGVSAAADSVNLASGVASATNAGDYSATYSLKSVNYKWSDGTTDTKTVSWGIAPVAPSISTPPSARTLAFNNAAQNLVNEGTAIGGTFQYSLDGGTHWGTVIPQGTNAGPYTVYYKLVGDGNHTDLESSSFTVTIGRAAISPIIEGSTTFPYSGSSPVLAHSGNPGGGAATFTYYADNGGGSSKGTLLGFVPVNAGAYWAEVSIAETGNYLAGTSSAVKYTITKIDPSNITFPVARTSLVSIDLPQNLVVPGSANGGTFHYSLTGTAESWSAEIPQGTNAGPYTVYYKLVGDGNHNDLEGGSFTVTIATKQGIFVTPDALTVEYATNLTLVNVQLPSNQYSWKTLTTEITSAGVYQFPAIYKANENTEAVEGFLQVNVEKATVSPPTLSVQSFPYTGLAPTLSTVGSNPGGGTPTFAYYADADATKLMPIPPANAGTYWVKVTFPETANYRAGISSAIQYQIEKATPVIDVFPAAVSSLTFSGEAQNLVNAGSASGGTLQYSLNNSTWGTEIPQGTNAGSYTVYYKLFGDGNHTDLNGATLNASIAKTTISPVIAAGQTFLYSGSSPALAFSGNLGGGTATFAYYEDNADGNSEGDPRGIPTNAGTYWAKVSIAESKNYLAGISTAVKYEIAKINASISKAPVAKAGLVFNKGVEQDLVTAGTTIGGTLQYSLNDGNWGTEIPQGADAGEYTVNYKVVGDGNYNGVAGGSLTVTIAQAAAEFSPFIMLSTEYAPSLVLADISGLLPSGYSWENSQTSITTIGAQQFPAIYKPNKNYAPASGNVTVYVAKRELSGNVDILPIEDQTYTGSAISPTFAVQDNTRVLTKDVDYTLMFSNNIAVGEATVIAIGEGNYTGTISAHFNIIAASSSSSEPSSSSGETPSSSSSEPEVSSSSSDEPQYSSSSSSSVIAGDDPQSSSSEGDIEPIIADGNFGGSFDLQARDGMLWVSAPLSRNGVSVQLYALSGAMTRSFSLAGGAHSVSLKDLPRGMYIAKAVFGSEKRIARVIVR